MKTYSLFSNDFSFVFRPTTVKEKPQESTLFWPVCNSTRFMIRSRLTVFIYTLDKSTDVITPMSCRTADANAASARSEIIYLSHAIANAENFWRYPATTGTSISTWKLRCNMGRKVVTRFSDYSLNDRYHEFSAPATTFLNFYFMAMNNRLLKCIIRKATLNRTKRHITCSGSWKD